MTAEQLVTARKYNEQFCKETLGYKKCNLEFVEGYIEKRREEARVRDHGDALLGPGVQPLQEGVRARRDERQLLAPA